MININGECNESLPSRRGAAPVEDYMPVTTHTHMSDFMGQHHSAIMPSHHMNINEEFIIYQSKCMQPLCLPVGKTVIVARHGSSWKHTALTQMMPKDARN